MAESYDYLVSGSDHRGRRVAAFVTATSGDAAVRDYESQGHSDIRLHTDDVIAPLMKYYSLSKFFTPKEQTALPRLRGLRRYFLLVWVSYRQIWFLVLFALAILAIAWFMGGTMSYLVELLAVMLLFFPFGANLYHTWFGGGARYLRLLGAIGYAQWDKALRLVPEMTLSLSPSELPTLKAQALAGRGRLEDALLTIDELADNPDLPVYVYWMAQSAVYQVAHEHEKVLGALAHAHELAPKSSLLMIAYAGMLIVVRRDLRQARDLLTRARRHVIAETTLPYLHHAEGLLALHEGRASEAVESLSTAVRSYEPYVRSNPSLLAIDARMRSRLCQAYAASGDTASARKQFRIARPILEAHRDEELLRQCEVAIG